MDGQPAPLAFAANRTAFRKGEAFAAQLGGLRPGGHHDVRVAWPWCAAIAFLGLTIESEAVPPLVEAAVAVPAPLRYVAYGDSLPHQPCVIESPRHATTVGRRAIRLSCRRAALGLLCAGAVAL